MLKSPTVLVLMFFITSITVFAQGTDMIVSGRIVDGTDNSPLPGVSVLLKGTATGTQTDGNGRYSISIPSGIGTLVFSYIGYLPQEVDIAGRTIIDVTLAVDAAQLQEVVVIGYQTVNRKDLTGATSVVSATNTQRNATRSLPEQLQGLAAGVSVRTGGGPGQEAVVNIRGLSTINGSANPLYVIDGVFSDPNTTVNPNDIETIQILKDASAAAIYGARAANGVIIITTKKGKEGPMQISASARYSVSVIPNRYDMMNGEQYVATAIQARQNVGESIPSGLSSYDPQTGVNINWANELLSTGSIQDYNLTLSGGSKVSKILVSGSYLKDEGALLGHSFERAALRINSEVSKGRFKLSENLMISNSTRNAPVQGGFEAGNVWTGMFQNLPIIPVRDASYISPTNPQGYGIGNAAIPTFAINQVAINDLWYTESNFFKLLGNIYLDFDILDNLRYRLNVAGETSFDHTSTIREIGITAWNQATKPSSVDEARGQFFNGMIEHTLNYDLSFDSHNISAVAGLSFQNVTTDYSSGGRFDLYQFGGNYFTTIGSATGDFNASGGRTQYSVQSYFGRVNYDYDDRYFASLTFRSDKSSLFSPNNRTGFFPSAAASWKISSEDFFSSEVVSLLKARVSYGILGVPGTTPYQFTGFLNQGTRAVFGPGDQQVFPGGTQARLVYDDLKWERKEMLNIGVDAAFLANTITASLDVFRSVSKDVLLEQPIAGYLGSLGGFPVVNIGSIENKGIELELGYRPISSGDFQWSVSGNVSIIRNEILSLGNLGINPLTGEARNYISSGDTRSQVGGSIGEYYVLRTDGIFQNQEEIDEHFAQSLNAQPGDIRFRNLIDGGSDNDINELDREFAGSPWPKFTTGLQGNFGYKNFSLSVQFYGAFGHTLYNGVIRDLDGMEYSNYRRGQDYWEPGNTDTNTPRLGFVTDPGILSNGRGDSDRWLENGSFFRLRNIELGYNFKLDVMEKINVSTFRVYISAQNLFTLTKYKGLDPDVVGANANLQPGVDLGSYPASRIMSVGLNVGF